MCGLIFSAQTHPAEGSSCSLIAADRHDTEFTGDRTVCVCVCVFLPWTGGRKIFVSYSIVVQGQKQESHEADMGQSVMLRDTSTLKPSRAHVPW